MIIAGMAMPAISAMPTGAPTSVPNCHRIFFFLLQGFLPQNVHPEGLSQEQRNQLNTEHNLSINKHNSDNSNIMSCTDMLELTSKLGCDQKLLMASK